MKGLGALLEFGCFISDCACWWCNPSLQEATNEGIMLSKLSFQVTKILPTVINCSGVDIRKSVSNKVAHYGAHDWNI